MNVPWRRTCARTSCIIGAMLLGLCNARLAHADPNQVVSGAFFGAELNSVSLKPAVAQRNGLTPGIGWALRAGIDLFDWVPINFGLRMLWMHDQRGFSQDVVRCTYANDEEHCGDPFKADSSVIVASLNPETGLQPTFRISSRSHLYLSPGLLLGYSKILLKPERSIDGCGDCRSEPLSINASGAYLAPTARFTWTWLALSLRYERYLSGDVGQAFGATIEAGHH